MPAEPEIVLGKAKTNTINAGDRSVRYKLQKGPGCPSKLHKQRLSRSMDYVGNEHEGTRGWPDH